MISPLTEEQEKQLQKKIVWLFGFPRSGTTWIATQLLSYQTRSINELNISSHLGIHNIVKGQITRNIESRKDFSDYFFSEKYKEVWIYFLRKLILNRIYAQIQDISQNIIIKEPSAFFAGDILSHCMPESKILILIRDGRDVIDSLVDAKQKEGFMTKSGSNPIEKKRLLRFISDQSNLWVNVMKNLMKTYKNHSEKLRMLIRYEDLRNNTLEELEKIYKFLEIEIDKKTLEKIVEKYSFENIPSGLKGKGKFARSASPGKWKENFNEKEQETINEIMKETLKKLEY